MTLRIVPSGSARPATRVSQEQIPFYDVSFSLSPSSSQLILRQWRIQELIKGTTATAVVDPFSATGDRKNWTNDRAKTVCTQHGKRLGARKLQVENLSNVKLFLKPLLTGVASRSRRHSVRKKTSRSERNMGHARSADIAPQLDNALQSCANQSVPEPQ